MAEYRTSRLPLAAFLKVERYELDSIEYDGRRGVFVFKEVPLQRIADFNNGKCFVEPNSFHDTVRNLVSMVRGSDHDVG